MDNKLINWFVPTDMIVGRTNIEVARIFVFTHLFGPILATPMGVLLLVMSEHIGYPAMTVIGGIGSFMVLPFVLKWTGNLRLVAFVSFQVLSMTSLFATFHYGGFSSPFLPWLIVSLLLGFFYLSKDLALVLALFSMNIAVFIACVVTLEMPNHISIEKLRILSWLSIIAATTYMSWMALYYSRMVAMRTDLELEAKRYNRISHDLEQAKQVAENLNEERSRFFSKMSHELRTPLNVIVGYSEVLEEELEDDKDTQEQWLHDVRRINSSGRMLMSLVGDVLDTDKMEKSQQEMDVSVFSIQAWCNDIQSTANALLEKNNNQFRIVVNRSEVMVQTDRQKLTQIALNLLSNAGKFTQNGLVQLTIQVEPGPAGRRLHMAISDNGVGIDSAALPKLFDSYIQADESIASKYGGTGLGLALCRKFCALLGGEISVTSTKGKGSTFDVEIAADLQIEADEGLNKHSEKPEQTEMARVA